MASEARTAAVTHPTSEDGPRFVRNRRRLYVVTTVALCGLMGFAVLDAVAPVFGVDSSTKVARGQGMTLRVEHPTVTRPGLASPFSIEVERAGGFDGPIEVAVSRAWIEAWDENGLYPSPSSETGDDQWVVWEFDPPDGDVLRFFYDARLEPARQTSVPGRVELRARGRRVAGVAFEAAVRP